MKEGIDEVKKKYIEGVCRVCNKITNQYFNINFEKAWICSSCESLIVKQSVIDKYK